MSDPVRLLDDPGAAAALKADLAQTAAAPHGVALAAPEALRAAIQGAGATAVASNSGLLAKLSSKILLGALVAGGFAIVGAAWATRDAAATMHTRTTPWTPPESAWTTASTATPSPLPRADAVLVQPAPAPKRPSHSAAKPRSRASTVKANTASRGRPKMTGDVTREAQLIARSRLLLQQNPSQALSMLRAAKRQFPHGMLVQERSALSVLALAKLGRIEQARTQGQAFLRAHAASPHAESVRRAIE